MSARTSRPKAVPRQTPALDPEARRRLAEAVHDLNTPLSAVKLQLFLRRRSLAQPTPEELHFLEVLDRNVERIRVIVASLAPPASAPRPGIP